VEIWELIYLYMITFQHCIMTRSFFENLHKHACKNVFARESRSEEEYPSVIHENESLDSLRSTTSTSARTSGLSRGLGLGCRPK
jgi:hypothetical protein